MSRAPEIPNDWVLEADGVGVRRGGRMLLADVTLRVRAGECVSIIGPNGAGKSTLLLTLLGLLAPTAGRLTLAGRSLRAWPPRARGRWAAYVPQTLELLPAYTVYDVVAAGRYPHVGAWRALSADDAAAIDAALQLCGLRDLADRRWDQISGGERQKTLLAAALAQSPRLLLLDEPTASLDPAYQVELLRALAAWHKGGGALIVVSHDLQLPTALGGRVLALRAGRVVADGPAGQVLAPESLGCVYGAQFTWVELAGGRRVAQPAW